MTIWVVTLRHKERGTRKVDTDVKYVRAETQGGAVKCAKFHSFMPARSEVWARIATPQDLGAGAATVLVPREPTVSESHADKRHPSVPPENVALGSASTTTALPTKGESK